MDDLRRSFEAGRATGKGQSRGASARHASERAGAQLRELESIIAFPGALNGLRLALHPDTGKGGDVRSRTAIFKTLIAVVARLGIS